jgi:hypothetical protein
MNMYVFPGGKEPPNDILQDSPPDWVPIDPSYYNVIHPILEQLARLLPTGYSFVLRRDKRTGEGD